MKYRFLGRTGVRVSELCFGCMTFVPFLGLGGVEQDLATTMPIPSPPSTSSARAGDAGLRAAWVGAAPGLAGALSRPETGKKKLDSCSAP